MKRIQEADGTTRKITRREKFLTMMNDIIPWELWLNTIRPFYPAGTGRGRPPIALEIILRMYLVQMWFTMSDPETEEAIYDSRALRHFVGLSETDEVPDETTLLHFRHLLEKHDLNQKLFDATNQLLDEKGLMMHGGTIVDATIIAAPSSTKNKDKSRDPEMHSTKKGNQYYFGMKAHIGVDAGTGLIHTVTSTAANASDISETHNLIREDDYVAYGDAGYRGIEKRDEIKNDEHLGNVDWRIAEQRSKIKKLSDIPKQWAAQAEHMKASVRSKVEHAFRIIKDQFGFRKVPYKGINKNHNRILGLATSANMYALAVAGRTI